MAYYRDTALVNQVLVGVNDPLSCALVVLCDDYEPFPVYSARMVDLVHCKEGAVTDVFTRGPVLAAQVYGQAYLYGFLLCA